MRQQVVAEASAAASSGEGGGVGDAAGEGGGAALSFTDIGRIVGERWKAASVEEKAEYEAIAAADRERFAIESRTFQREQEEREAAAQKGKRGPNKKTLEARAAMAAVAAGGASPAGGADGTPTPASPATKGAPSSGGMGSADGGGKRRKGEGGVVIEVGGGGSKESAEESLFPMDDKALMLREKAHRQMLVASGRSQPAADGDDLNRTPAYVYPPHGPPPPVLPPLPTLPTPSPIHPPPGLGARDLTRLMTLWDFVNTLGETFKLRPVSMPLHALINAVCGDGAVECVRLERTPSDPALYIAPFNTAPLTLPSVGAR